MQSQERELIEGLFGRLKGYESQPRDPEADRLIATLVTAQPGAPYLLTQTVLVQEQALKAAQARIAELEAKVPPAPPPSFLGSAPKVGPWGSAPGAAPTTPAAPPPGGPWQQAAQQPLQQQPQPMIGGGFGGGGGFLRSALTTAAGVAGGALLFEGIRNMMGGHTSAWAAPNSLAGDTSGLPSDSPLMPPDNVSPADLARDNNTADDYNTASDDSSFDSGGFDDNSSDV